MCSPRPRPHGQNLPLALPATSPVAPSAPPRPPPLGLALPVGKGVFVSSAQAHLPPPLSPAGLCLPSNPALLPLPGYHRQVRRPPRRLPKKMGAIWTPTKRTEDPSPAWSLVRPHFQEEPLSLPRAQAQRPPLPAADLCPASQTTRRSFHGTWAHCPTEADRAMSPEWDFGPSRGAGRQARGNPSHPPPGGHTPLPGVIQAPVAEPLLGALRGEKGSGARQSEAQPPAFLWAARSIT